MDRIADVLGAIVTLALITQILSERWNTIQTVFGPILDPRGSTSFVDLIEETGDSFRQSIQRVMVVSDVPRLSED